MTTMDSDSESQDSDEGRRFRFEATRKDSLVGVNSRNRRPSPARSGIKRRSRSADRSNRDRRNVERSREDYKKKSRNNTDVKRPSRDRDSKYSKEIGDSSRGSSRYRDSKDTKNFSNLSSNQKDSKISRESPSTSSRRNSTTRERDRRRSVERSTDRSYDDKHKYTNKFAVRNKRQSRERSRERSYQGSKPKAAVEILARSSRDEINKTETTRKITRKDNETKNIKDVEKNLEETNVNSESDSNSRASSPSSRPECKDLNLSDFDIVSDIEENSSDDSISRKISKETTRTSDDNTLAYDGESGIKKRVSKQQYERLLKRQAVKNRRSLEELHKVKATNGEQPAGTSDNNRNAISDFLLGKTTAITTVTKLSVNLVDHEDLCRKESTSIINNDKNTNLSDSDNSESNGSTYGPILPPKIPNTSCLILEDKNDKEVSPSKEKIATRVIGPTLPAHFKQNIDDAETDAEDTFGPALPPHLEQKTTDNEPEDDVMGLSVSTDNASEKEDCGGDNRAESEGDDDDMMGPLPSDHPALENDIVQQQLELRARRIKAELAACDDEDKDKREEWMIELPSAKTVHLGLGPRKFRVRPAPDMTDRSSWTDTPADKARKRIEKLENRNMVVEPTINQDRDVSNASSEKEKSKKRQQSLLEMHQKKLHKKKKKEEKEAKRIGKTVERRPFDRDVDLQANRFDDARKKNMLSKARQLDDRFSRGKI